MSVEAQVAKLESLLERIQSNRRPYPISGATTDAAEPAAPPVQEAQAPEEAPAKPVQPTPMEQALKAGLDRREEPEIEISVDEDEPEITIEAEEAPTAPVGTPAPTPQPAPTAPVGTRAPAAQARGPQAVELPSPTAPSSPVAKVTATAKPRTFGELIARTLALRPR